MPVMQRRLIESSIGWIEITFSDEQRYASLSRLDGAGWVTAEYDWDGYDSTLSDAFEGLGVPTEEAHRIAGQTEEQWLQRGEIAPPKPLGWWGLSLLGAILIATVGVWLAGVGFLVWLAIRLAS